MMHNATSAQQSLRQYMLVTFNYWNFTLTDGALRMLVVLYFHQLGYNALTIASLFLFYEFFGVVTNLVGGWLGARWGLNRTMNIGLAMQILALLMLALPNPWLTIPWVMAAQALSGIAKDLNKMSAKSAIKTLVPDEQQGALYRWVAILTGSKNALKGAGFFLGGLLLAVLGFQQAMLLMASVLTLVLLGSLLYLNQEMGKAKHKVKFRHLLAKSAAINWLSAARLCLFAARDVWFVVALPVYLGEVFGWSHLWVGGFLAIWVMGYGVVQGLAPKITNRKTHGLPQASALSFWAFLLTLLTFGIAAAVQYGLYPQQVIVIGLLSFGAIFAINSSLHSYWIVRLASGDGVSMDVGFYYMANASGRLLGTIASGALFQWAGLSACLWASAILLAFASLLALPLAKISNAKPLTAK
ncbi:hypothetical protein VST7929_02077 [Vibrio stylophorae]|uniref:MFS transporter n=1 Tax=Vibrio stylophorae TaxID=659351 RepID=A0ABN8DV55_9VIBR|nr:organoarsenical effux MFS transporter ArsJ [Vibrio stylophorae]CAH0534169.1 hypothetical protein VST7929_02077 [Vibrio stylophorae]